MPLTSIVLVLTIIAGLFMLHTVVSDRVKQRRLKKYLAKLSREE